ncbi:porin family protein [Rhizobium sp. TRM95111]|uniref:outer membrane protein n=1 Tax=Rhizobium alarense TaxID=2846851 RepID=UPI001F44C142|nr:outer membrane protein [Rhizobium alarense]MCF3638381.1 porin family protein [Rhizobium alarense]
MKKMLSGVFAVLAAATAAEAADVYQPEVIQAPAIEQPVVAAASGWYLRGDIGWGYNDLRGAHFYQGSNANRRSFDSADLKSSFSLGGGVGYQINNYLRTDVTLDYMFNADFEGSTSGGCGVAADCVSTDRSSLSALSLLANAYVDIGTYGIVTPYVGAGIGGTYVKWDDLENTSCENGDPTNCDPTVTHKGKRNWRFTYALMAGASVDLACNLKADAGYRFRHVTGGNMFGYAMNGGPGSDKGFYTHEARLGLRYMLDACQEATYMPPADIPVQQPVYK